MHRCLPLIRNKVRLHATSQRLTPKASARLFLLDVIDKTLDKIQCMTKQKINEYATRIGRSTQLLGFKD
jgi:hypothetical protein